MSMNRSRKTRKYEGLYPELFVYFKSKACAAQAWWKATMRRAAGAISFDIWRRAFCDYFRLGRLTFKIHIKEHNHSKAFALRV